MPFLNFLIPAELEAACAGVAVNNKVLLFG
jgi:hypothetical protein